MSKQVLTDLLTPEFAEPFIGLVEEIEAREDAIAEKICSAFTTDEMVSLVKDSEFFAESNEHQDYKVHKLLLRALRMSNNADEHFIDLALDNEREWYVRFTAINSLSEIGDKSLLLKLLPLVQDTSLEGEIREATLRALSINGVTEALPTIQSASSEGFVLDGELNLVCARGYLGDETVLGDLLQFANDEWSSRASRAREALAALVVVQGGAEAVARRISSGELSAEENSLVAIARDVDDENLKLWAIRETPADAEGIVDVLIDCLASPFWQVQFASSERLTGVSGIGGKLLQIAGDPGRPREQRLWALRSALEAGSSPDGDLIVSLGDFATPWGFDAGSIARRVVVGRFARHPQRGTDIAYFLEWHLQEQPPEFDVAQRMSELSEAIGGRQLSSSEWKEIGEYNKHGYGECWVLDIEYLSVYLNKHAPLAQLFSRNSEPGDDDLSLVESVTEVLAENGVDVLSAELLDNVVPGLNVYFFGSREPLRLRDLLFYWQD